MRIRWSNCISEPFTVSNGVKQGGILFPSFFNVYMDGLSMQLTTLGIVAQLAGRVVNHLGYADDLCLLSLSGGGMQQLLSCCERYSEEHDLVYNGTKSVCLLRRPQTYKSPMANLIIVWEKTAIRYIP